MATTYQSPLAASASRMTPYASSMPVPPNSYVPSLHSASESYYRGGGAYTWRSPYEETRSGTATVYSDGGMSDEMEPSWYRRDTRTPAVASAGAVPRPPPSIRRRPPPPVFPEYDDDDEYDDGGSPEFDFSQRRRRHSRMRPLSALFDEVVHGVQNRLKMRSARPQRPAPYEAPPPPPANYVARPLANANNIVDHVAVPTPRRSSIDVSTLDRLANGSLPSAASTTTTTTIHRDGRPDPTPIQAPHDPVVPIKIPASPSPSSLGPLASFASFLETLRTLPFITPDSFSSRGERKPITQTYTPSSSSSRAIANMSRARMRGAIRYGRRGELEGELAKGECWYMPSVAQEQRAARRAVRRSMRKQEKARKKGGEESVLEGGPQRSNTMTSMAYSYSHGPALSSTGHERRPTGSSHRTLVATPLPTYQGQPMMVPSPYGVVPVTYAPYGAYAPYGYQVYTPQAAPVPQPQPQEQDVTVDVVPPTPAQQQQQAERSLSGSSGRSHRSRGNHHRANSKSKSRSGSEDSIIPVPPDELPPALRAAVSADALRAA